MVQLQKLILVSHKSSAEEWIYKTYKCIYFQAQCFWNHPHALSLRGGGSATAVFLHDSELYILYSFPVLVESPDSRVSNKSRLIDFVML